jgi:hypothetical protein
MANQVASKQTINIVPVQGIFGPEPSFTPITLVGPAGSYFYPAVNPVQSGLTITNSTIDSSVIGGTTPAAAYFTAAQVAATPTADQDVANKAYVDSVAQGLDIKASCLYTTTGDIALSGLGTQANGDWPSGLTGGDRILVKNQTNSAENGIYVAASGAWARSADMNTWSEVPGSFTFIEDGNSLSSTGWVTTAGSTGTIGVTPMPWTQFSGAGTYTAGNGLQLISNAFSVKLNGTTLDASPSGVKISDTYPGQTSITTLGTIATGTWEATDVAVLHGGTGASDAAGARSNLSAAILGANNDITSMTGLTGGISTPTFIEFDQTPGVTVTNGQTAWNPDYGTLDLGMGYDAVTQQIGFDSYFLIKASAPISKGELVMFTGSVGASGVLTGAPSATGLAEGLFIMGVATMNMNTNDFGYVQNFGEVRGFDTTGTSVGEVWADGDILYYNPAYIGGMTKTRPTSPAEVVVVAAVVNAGPGGSGSVFVRVSFYPRLGELSNVYTPSPSNGDVLAYNTSNLRWQSLGQSSLSAGYATTAGSAGSSTTATNLDGGAAGSLPYQSASATTTFLGLGVSTYILTAGGSAPQWSDPAGITVGTATNATNATTATNLAGGAAASIPYQTGAGATSFIASGAGDAGKVLQSNGTSAASWVTPVAYATVTDDTTTNATFYPLIANQTAGNLTTEYTSSTKLQYNPSSGLLSATTFSGSGASLTALPAGELSGTIPSGVLGNSTVYIGTTGIALNRGSASQSLTGVSIDGSAGSAATATDATNAVNVGITDDTSTNSDYYPVWVTNSTGNLPAKVSSTKLKFNPSSGVLTTTGGIGGGAF